MEKLFDVVTTAYDPKAKPVHLCKSADGYYVYKPSSGFKSRAFAKENNKKLLAIYERQRHDAQTFASYLPGEAPGAPVEETPVVEIPVVETQE